jgi:hypothetical protein
VAFATNPEAARELQEFSRLTVLGEVQDRLDVLRSKLAGPRLDLCGEIQDKTGTQGTEFVAVDGERREQMVRSNAQAVRIRQDKRTARLMGKCGDEGIVFESARSEGTEVLDGEGLEALYEKRNQCPADANTGPLHVAIGGVLAPVLPELLEVGPKCGSTEAEQWANDSAGHGMNAGEPGESSAAEEVREHGFGLIVRRMCGSHVAKMLLLGDPREPLIANAPPGVFEVTFGTSCEAGDVGMCATKLKAEMGGQLGHELLVGIRRATAKLVIEVQHDRDDTKAFAEIVKQSQQRHGIGAAGDSHTNAIPGVEKRLRP